MVKALPDKSVWIVQAITVVNVDVTFGIDYFSHDYFMEPQTV